MEDKYIFIIWNKALFAKEKILKDLSISFEIINTLYIEWDKDKFDENLLALYGRKLGSPEEKKVPCGTGKFFLIICKDNNPIYEERKMYDGFQIVNSKIYDKKALYRKWTAGSHRIHCSVDDKEFNHDIAVLFGGNYNITNSSINTKGVEGFNSIDDFENNLKLFCNPRFVIKDDTYYIFCNCRYDLVSFLKCKQISKNKYVLNINDESFYLYIFGVIDKDIDSLGNINIKSFIINIDDNIKKINSIDPSRKGNKINIIKKIILSIKLIKSRLLI